MGRSNSGDWRIIFGTDLNILNIGLMTMEEQDGRRRRQQENISILFCFVKTRNSFSPSSSRSFRTQSHWSYTAGQCSYSERFFRAQLSYRMCSQFTLHHEFTIDSGSKQGKTGGIFFVAVNPMNNNHRDPQELDLTKPRLASYKQKKWKRHQDTVYWVDIQLAQRKGLKFCQSRCIAIIHYDILPACCISKIVVMECGEIIYEKAYVSLWPPPTISLKDNWMKELDSEVAGSSKDTQRIQPKPKTHLSRTVRPVGGQQSTKVEEFDNDFRVPWLSHAVVKEAEQLRVQELLKKIGKSSSSWTISCRFAAEWRLQPIQPQFESDDPRIG